MPRLLYTPLLLAMAALACAPAAAPRSIPPAPSRLVVFHRDHARHGIFLNQLRYRVDGELMVSRDRGVPPRLKGYQIASHDAPQFRERLVLGRHAPGNHTLHIELVYDAVRCCYAGCFWRNRIRIKRRHDLSARGKPITLCVRSGRWKVLTHQLPVVEVEHCQRALPPF